MDSDARRYGWLRREGLFFSVYAVVTAVMTYPVIFRIGSVFYGLPEDPLLFQWMFWYMARGGGGWVLGRVPIIGYPSGVDLSFWAREMGVFLPGRILTWMFGQTAAYNLLILASFILAGVFMYYLVRHLTGSQAAAFLAGLAYAFCPYHLEHAMVHVNLAGIEWLPLFFLCFFKLLQKRAWGNALLSAVTFTVVTLSDFHYGVFAAMLVVVILLVRGLFALRGRRQVRFNWSTALKLGVALAVVAVLVAPFFITLAGQSKSAAFKRRAGRADLIKFSARPLEYVLPAAANPFLGPLTRGYEYSHLHNAEEYETSNYLGFVVMALALVGLVMYLGRGRGSGDAGGGPGSGEGSSGFSPTDERSRLTVIWSMLAGVLLFFVLSMPPYFTVGRTRIYLPSELVHRVLPLFRSYSRFSLMVLFCALILAAYGLAGLLERGWFKRHAALFVAALAVLVLFEYTIVPPFRYTVVEPPLPAYAWLAGQAYDGPVAAYPMDQKGWYVYQQLYGQTAHGKTLVNAGGLPYGVDPQYQYVMDLAHPYTPRVLASLGVKKAFLIPSMWRQAVSLQVPASADRNFQVGLLPPGYRIERAFADGLALEVTAEPAVLVPHFMQGFEEPSLVNNEYYRQRLDGTGRITMENRSGARSAASLSFYARAESGPVRVEMTLDGRAVAAWDLGPAEQTLSTPLLDIKSGGSRLELRVTRGAGGSGATAAITMSALDVTSAGPTR